LKINLCINNPFIEDVDQWFPTGEEFLPREEFHEFRGRISAL